MQGEFIYMWTVQHTLFVSPTFGITALTSQHFCPQTELINIVHYTMHYVKKVASSHQKLFTLFMVYGDWIVKIELDVSD